MENKIVNITNEYVSYTFITLLKIKIIKQDLTSL